MKRLSRCLVSLVVAPLLCSCTGRTILHGMPGLTAHRQRDVPREDNRLSVWFVKPAAAGGCKVVPVIRRLSNGSDRIEQSLKELLSGPTTAEEHMGLGTEIPRGTILLAVNKHGNAIDIDLSRRFAMDGGTTSFETRLQQLKQTVAPVAGRMDVYLDVEGKRLNMEEGEGIEIHQPINR